MCSPSAAELRALRPAGRPRHLLLPQSDPPLRAGAISASRPPNRRRRRRAGHRHDRRRGRRLSRRTRTTTASYRSFSPRPPAPIDRLKMIAERFPGIRLRHLARRHHRHAADLAADARRWSSACAVHPLPIAVGFGISNAEHVAAVGEFADAPSLAAPSCPDRKADPGKAPNRDFEPVLQATSPGLQSSYIRSGAGAISYKSKGQCMDIADWRRRSMNSIVQIVALISARADAAQEIGKLKRSTACRSTSRTASGSSSRMCAPPITGRCPISN